jgi:hypothetical protein
MKTFAKVILFLVLGLVGLCIVFAVIGAILNRGATITPTLNPTQTINPTETSKPTNTLDPSITPATPTKTIVPTKTKAPTKTLVPTSIYARAGSMSQFIATYLGKTNLQRDDFAKASVGLPVNWTGTISSVDPAGFLITTEVLLLGPSNTSVNLQDIPLDVERTLSVGQTIHFTGVIDDVQYYAGIFGDGNMAMIVKNVQIIK